MRKFLFWAFPILYGALYITRWRKWPETIAVHFDANGMVTKYGGKTELLPIAFLPITLSLIVFIIITVFGLKKEDKNNWDKEVGYLYNSGIIINLAIIVLFEVSFCINYGDAFGVSTGRDMSAICFSVIIPFLMIAMGLIMYKLLPGKRSKIIGYRTKRSCSSQIMWDYANKYCGRLWIVLGIIMLPISVAIISYGQSFESITYGRLLIAQTFIVVASGVGVEIKLKLMECET